MKKLLSLLLALAMVFSLAGCGSSETSTETQATTTETSTASTAAAETTTETAAETPAETAEEGTVFNIYAWNEEFKGFFEKYYEVPEGVTVNWIIVPSDNGQYQDALDNALLNQENASADEKVDMFLAEADYILKYADSAATQDVEAIGVTDFSNAYTYTVEAASDASGVVKGVSFQCCPSGMVYRRSIAEEVLGVSEPEDVQALVSDWDKFDEVAAKMKAAGYYMTPSYAETFRPFSNNASSAWVVDGQLSIPAEITEWMDQAEEYVANGYTLTAGIWDDEKNQASMPATGTSFCLFGPAWYFNFCMGPAWDETTGTIGDWGLIEGPAAHFWGGTWLLAASGSDNPTMLADVMNTFINDEEVCENLVVNEAQFSNNKAVNAKIAEDDELGANELLGGQNATALFCSMTDNIKFQNQTIYDQLCNEGLQTYFVEYLKGSVESREAAIKNFYTYISEKYPSVVIPE